MKKQNTPEVIRQDIPVLRADPDQGLTGQQAQERKMAGWANAADTGAGLTERQIILRNCLTFFNLVFIVLAVVLVCARSSVMNMTFLGIVFVNTVIGCFQEIRAKRAVDKLTLVAARPVRTVRDGQVTDIPSADLVRDDIVNFRQEIRSALTAFCAAGNCRSMSRF